MEMVIDAELRSGIEDACRRKEPVDEVGIISDLRSARDVLKELPDLQIVIDGLDEEVTDIEVLRFCEDVLRRSGLSGEIDIDADGCLIGVVFSGISGDLPFGIFQRIVGDPEELAVLSYFFYISSGGLTAHPVAVLDVIGRILKSSVIIKFHKLITQGYYTITYNNIQQIIYKNLTKK